MNNGSNDNLQLWRAARKVLAIRLDSIGDVLMTSPALGAVISSGCEVTLLTSPAGAQATEGIRGLSKTLVYTAPWMKPGRGRIMPAEEDYSIISAIRNERFDAAIIFTVYSQSSFPAALICYLAGVPLRAGYCRENPYSLLTDWIKEREPERQIRHEVDRQIALVARLGFERAVQSGELIVPEAGRSKARALLRELGVDLGRPLAVLHPGASASSRQYPASRFREVARRLSVEHGVQIVVTGCGEEQAIVDQVTSGECGIINLCSALSLSELAAVIEQAHLLISNNTGPVHLACCVGTPVVAIYALTNPQHTPWGVRHRTLYNEVPCCFCYKSVCPNGDNLCISAVEPSEVVKASIEVIAGGGTAITQPITARRACSF
ncbi:MAG: lipopolysaccharide heptosyltransferase II [Deltaproteobacteria bacterium]|nr:lipopolysaccharide heptosyltransferase II [Deltaproteobacteria bacterium]